MKALFPILGKAIVILAALSFLGFGEVPKAYSHHEESCAAHHHDGGAEETGCQDTKAGHNHAGEGACKLGHCHASYAGALSQHKIALRHLAPLKALPTLVEASAYLNPYLGIPLQPPRA